MWSDGIGNVSEKFFQKNSTLQYKVLKILYFCRVEF